MYANAIYWRRTRRLIADLPTSIATNPQKRVGRLERDGGTAPGATAGVLIGVGFFGIFVLGILAAIAIPAYQDYTIRAQVIEGLNLASPIKYRVADYWTANATWPEQADLGASEVVGKYVSSVNVASGSVVITYGNQANSRLADQRLILVPGVLPDGEVVWACGYEQLPEEAQSAGGPYGSTLAPKYLPSVCRKGGTDHQYR
jgi:type IV pilus assembly protein PilA